MDHTIGRVANIVTTLHLDGPCGKPTEGSCTVPVQKHRGDRESGTHTPPPEGRAATTTAPRATFLPHPSLGSAALANPVLAVTCAYACVSLLELVLV